MDKQSRKSFEIIKPAPWGFVFSEALNEYEPHGNLQADYSAQKKSYNDCWDAWQAAIKQSQTEWLNIDFIDSQLKEKGMITLTELLESKPNPFMLHAGVDDFDTFCQWVELRYKETTKLKALQLAKKGQDIIETDELYDWSCAMANAYQEMYQQWKVVESNAKSQIESLQAENKNLDLMVAQNDYNVDMDAIELKHLRSQNQRIKDEHKRSELAHPDTYWSRMNSLFRDLDSDPTEKPNT